MDGNAYKQNKEKIEAFISYIKQEEGFYAIKNMLMFQVVVIETSDKELIKVFDEYDNSQGWLSAEYRNFPSDVYFSTINFNLFNYL